MRTVSSELIQNLEIIFQVVLITIFERERHFLLYIAPHKIMNLALLICPAGLINKDQPHKLGGVILKSCSGFEGAGAGANTI